LGLRQTTLMSGSLKTFELDNGAPKAIGACKDSFVLWKDADPDIPILVAAKAEFEKLK